MSIYRPVPAKREDETVDYTYAEIVLPPTASELEIKSLEQPYIFGDQVHFFWDNIVVRATIIPYNFPPVDADEFQYEFRNHPIVQKRVINPIIHQVKFDLCTLIPLLERFKQLPKNVLSKTAFSYYRTSCLENHFMHVYRVNDSTSWGENNGNGLLKCVLDYKGVSKRIVPGEEDLVDMTENIEMVDGMNFACVSGENLKEAFERALRIYEMNERIRGAK
ncbi:MAG: hypothetical protein Q8N99_07540 [Nanoarchaeota archaeon]|nr:hypothetical protein [Nanoarchaeota archaeon]